MIKVTALKDLECIEGCFKVGDSFDVDSIVRFDSLVSTGHVKKYVEKVIDDDGDLYLSVKEMAEVLNVPKHKIYNIRKKFPIDTKEGENGAILLRKKDVEECLSLLM